ncbi:ATP-dependent DNA ligase [Orpheovirus IHUMI-LCC2]|uniref:DNA ligase n=1 Tax=Orpheovirus IHUMI-LCC2 TaxID=2023057 RepID=A0A2I2L5V8_9VIRU|nr:ATP-dependent DNA ligase [Orpheovirus IHUMI-LCC2]SNW62932.1 ATP-dependent DNA ligase [Orpheovirus IHUMI-LCC2]
MENATKWKLLEDGDCVFNVRDDPNKEPWFFQPIYKTSLLNKDQVWQIGFDGKNLIIIHGDLDGKHQIEEVEVQLASKNTLREQAILNARNRYRLKYRKGYRLIGERLMNINFDKEPMLCHKFLPKSEYEKMKEEKNKGTRKWDNGWTKLEKGDYPVAVEPKLDGLRVKIRLSGNGIIIKSRQNTDYHHLTHIETSIIPLFMYLPDGSIIDGEMYNHDYDFEELQSIIRSDVNIHPLLSTVYLYIFDVYIPEVNGIYSFEQRYDILLQAYKQYVQNTITTKQNIDDGTKNEDNKSKEEDDEGENLPVVEDNIRLVMANVVWNEEELITYYKKCLEDGYEGIIIRRLAYPEKNVSSRRFDMSTYKNGRSKRILKYKPEDDDEGIIIGVKDCKGREKGAAKFVVKDKNGKEFNARMTCPLDQRRSYLANPSLVIGKLVTYIYQGLTIHGLPRFPRARAFRDVTTLSPDNPFQRLTDMVLPPID